MKALRIDHLDVTATAYIFNIITALKQTRPGFHQPPIFHEKYSLEPKLCVHNHLIEYLKRTQSLRADCKQLLITLCRPYRPASLDTVSRWCKEFLKNAGIDTMKYKTHSTRAASTSHVVRNSPNSTTLNDIFLAAGGTNENTFRRFYNVPSLRSFNFGTALLSSQE